MNKTIKTNINTTKQMLRKAKEISVLLKRLELAEREYIYLKETEEKRRKTLKREYENVSQKVVLDERSLKIIELRKKGMTLKEIAPLVGLTYGSVRIESMKIKKLTTEMDNCYKEGFERRKENIEIFNEVKDEW